MRYFMIVLSMVLWANIVEAGESDPINGEAQVGNVATLHFVCRTEDILRDVLGKPSDPEITDTANMAITASMCGWSAGGFQTELKEYLGSILMAADPPGTAYIYRIEDQEGGSHYSYVFVPTRGA